MGFAGRRLPGQEIPGLIRCIMLARQPIHMDLIGIGEIRPFGERTVDKRNIQHRGIRKIRVLEAAIFEHTALELGTKEVRTFERTVPDMSCFLVIPYMDKQAILKAGILEVAVVDLGVGEICGIQHGMPEIRMGDLGIPEGDVLSVTAVKDAVPDNGEGEVAVRDSATVPIVLADTRFRQVRALEIGIESGT